MLMIQFDRPQGSLLWGLANMSSALLGTYTASASAIH